MKALLWPLQLAALAARVVVDVPRAPLVDTVLLSVRLLLRSLPVVVVVTFFTGAMLTVQAASSMAPVVQRRGDVLDARREDDAARHDLVDRGVGRVASAREGVEARLAPERAGEAPFEIEIAGEGAGQGPTRS